jgi:hypothetical protein
MVARLSATIVQTILVEIGEERRNLRVYELLWAAQPL